MKFSLSVAAFAIMAQVAAIPLDHQVWNITNFEAYAMEHTGSSTVSFNVTASYPGVVNLLCTNTTNAMDRLATYVAAPCQNPYWSFSFNFTDTLVGDGSKQLAVQWRFTSHGGYVGSYTIPASQIKLEQSTSGNPLDTSQVYTGPKAFQITDFRTVTYDNPN